MSGGIPDMIPPNNNSSIFSKQITLTKLCVIYQGSTFIQYDSKGVSSSVLAAHFLCLLEEVSHG